MLSVVILNYMRPQNVQRIVPSLLAEEDLVDEVIVWNNGAPISFPDSRVTTISASRNLMDLYPRYHAVMLCKNEGVLVQDDDVLLSREALVKLHERWQAEPRIIHGPFGRRPGPEMTYTSADAYGECEVVISKTLIASKRLVPRFLAWTQHPDVIAARGKLVYRGEDILFSYAAMAQSGRLNRAYADLPITALPSPHAMAGHPDHIQARTLVLRAAAALLAAERA